LSVDLPITNLGITPQPNPGAFYSHGLGTDLMYSVCYPSPEVACLRLLFLRRLKLIGFNYSRKFVSIWLLPMNKVLHRPFVLGNDYFQKFVSILL
jgi:hypothetical protein